MSVTSCCWFILFTSLLYYIYTIFRFLFGILQQVMYFNINQNNLHGTTQFNGQHR